MLQTKRLILRKWTNADANSLFEYAGDPDIGPIAGWPPHRSVEESLAVIQNVLNGRECYAICEKECGQAIGSIELKLNGYTDMTDRDDECELGYWLGKPYWGRGYMPEAAAELLRHAFKDLHMSAVWCGYYDGNAKSRRVQEKLGFLYHHSCDSVPVPLMHETRIGHTNLMTKQRWLELHDKQSGSLRGICFTVNDADAFFQSMENMLDVSTYDWYVDDVELNYFEFPTGRLSGAAFKELMAELPRLSFVRLRRYPCGAKIDAVETSEDFAESACDVLILFYDGGLCELFAKDKALIHSAYSFCADNGFDGLRYSYDAPGERSCMHF